jgi:hypothetical protein
MFEYLFEIFSKPFLGLIIAVRLFGVNDQDSNDPSVASLNFVRTADSVFVQAVIRNGLTAEIKDLMQGGVVVKTTCTFTCDTFFKSWDRKLQYNPVKRCGCYLCADSTCERIFKEESLGVHFNRIKFYLANYSCIKKMQSMQAKLKISTSINVEALSIGEKKLWPDAIVESFIVPQMPIIK